MVSSPTANVATLSAVFFFIFSAYLAAQSLSTTVLEAHEAYAHVCLLVLYACFSGGSLMAGRNVQWLGARGSIRAGSIPYVMAVASFMMSPSYALGLPVFAAAGFGASLLWAGQANYLMQNAAAQADSTGEPQEDALSRLNGVFFGVFLSTGAVGLLLATLVVYLGGSTLLLFGIMTALGALGAMLAWCLQPVCTSFSILGHSSSSQLLAHSSFATSHSGLRGSMSSADDEAEGVWPPPNPSQVMFLEHSRVPLHTASRLQHDPLLHSSGAPLGGVYGGAEDPQRRPATLQAQSPQEMSAAWDHPCSAISQVFTSGRMALLVPAILYSGMCMGFVGTDFRLLYSQALHSWVVDGVGHEQLLPTRASSIVLCVWLFGDGVVSMLGGRLVPFLGRSGLFCVAGIAHFMFLAALALITAAPSALPAADSVGSWALVLGLMVVYSTGEGILQPQLPAVLQSESVFASAAARRSANANMRVWQPLGFAIQMGLGALGCPLWLQALLLMLVLLVSMLCLLFLHVQVCSLDGDSLSSPPGSRHKLPQEPPL